MASSKEVQQASRPLTHRPSLSSSAAAAGSLTPRQSHSRNNSHSILSTSLNANHRVTRRKSVTGSNANAAAVAAVLSEAGERATAMPIVGGRRNTMSKTGASRPNMASSVPSPPASLPTHTHKFVATNVNMDLHDSAIDDELNDMSDGENMQKARVRRASDGQPLVREGRKINRVELRCETCGKGYKHSSCLTKHLWEHTPEWSITSKFLISKHQQVQLLEAASVLMTITNKAKDETTPPDSARDFASDRDSASPAASGYSDQRDGRSSADTTPPPQLDGLNATNASYRTISKRFSSGSGFSRSYQSAPSAGSIAGSAPNGNGFGHYRQLSQEQRPMSSDSDVAAAMLSCSLGSNSGGSRTVHLPSDAPPVPPVPAQYLEQGTLTGTSFINSFHNRAPESFARGDSRRERDDIKMEGSGESIVDEDDDMSRARSDEDDDGVFGRMEE